MTYVDNAHNRRLGRVGKPYGTHVEHVDGTITIYDPSKDVTPTRIYADNSTNQSLGRAGKKVLTPFPCRYYVDNPSNRRLGRAGEPYVGLDEVYHKLAMSTSTGVYQEKPAQIRPVQPKAIVLQDKTGNREIKTEPRALFPAKPELWEEKPTNPGPLSRPGIKEEKSPALPRRPGLKLPKTTDSDPFEEGKSLQFAKENQAPPSRPKVLSPTDPTAENLSNDRLNGTPTTTGGTTTTKNSSEDSRHHTQSTSNEIHEADTSTDGPACGDAQHNEVLLPEEKGHSCTALWLPNGLPVTYELKKIRNISQTLAKSEKWKTKVMREIKFLCSLVHPNIATLYGAVYVADVGTVNMVMECYPRSLHQAIFVDKDQFSEHRKFSLMKQISAGMEHLHSLGVALCTFSSGTVQLNDQSSAKIESFGPKTVCCENRCLRDHIDEGYAAPELSKNILFTTESLQKADIYSLAQVLYELFEYKNASKRNAVIVPQKNGTDRKLSGVPSSVRNLLLECWSDRPEKRPEAAAFLHFAS